MTTSRCSQSHAGCRPVLDTLKGYEAAVATGDNAAVTAMIDEMLTAGAQPVTVLTDVIAAAQRAVGARWQRGEWTVAQEHAATAIAVDATKVVMKYVRRTPLTRGRIIVTCAEREWHALPAMIIGCALRSHGWDTTLLGSSTSALRLNQFLQDLGPEAVAVSCSMLGALSTTRRSIEASTAAGVPIVVGGSAFGHDNQRARALGATAWARDAQGAVTAVSGLPAVVPPAPPLPAASAGEQAALELSHRQLVATLRAGWSLTGEAPAAGEEPTSAALADADDVLHQLLHAVSAALLTGDARPVAETSAWIADLMQNRGVDIAQVRELGELLGTTLRDYPRARGLVEQYFAAGLA
jgi:MerR family transcriptional regulator, light-induced transcriptional regulator